jgi:hypothetical protein
MLALDFALSNMRGHGPVGDLGGRSAMSRSGGMYFLPQRRVARLLTSAAFGAPICGLFGFERGQGVMVASLDQSGLPA